MDINGLKVNVSVDGIAGIKQATDDLNRLKLLLNEVNCLIGEISGRSIELSVRAK